jgi:hypothetical protein
MRPAIDGTISTGSGHTVAVLISASQANWACSSGGANSLIWMR